MKTSPGPADAIGDSYVKVTDFTGGEISPTMEGRTDLQRYYSSCRRILNMIPLAQGGCRRRAGTQLICPLPIPAPYDGMAAWDKAPAGANDPHLVAGRLVPFTDTEANAYVAIFQNALLANGQSIVFAGNAGLMPPGASGGGSCITFAGDAFPTYVLDQLQWAQEQDVMWFNGGVLASGPHGRHPGTFVIGTLEYDGTTPFKFSTSKYSPNPPPFMGLNGTIGSTAVTKMTLSAATGSVTITASAIRGLNRNQGFQSTDVGRVLRLLLPDPLLPGFDPTLNNGAVQWCLATITAVTDTTHVTATLAETVPDIAPNNLKTTQWMLSVPMDFLCVAFWGGRLWYANSSVRPNALFGSAAGNFTNFAPSNPDSTVTADNALALTITDPEADGIQWLSAAGGAQQGMLGIGTASHEHILSSGSMGQGLSATSIQGYEESAYGSAQNVRPIKIANTLIIPQKYGKKLSEWNFTWQVYGFRATDLLRYAEHLTQAGGIIRMVFQQNPQWTLWFVTEDYRLLSLTYLPEEQVLAWARHVLGGAYLGGPALALDICAIPNPNTGEDELFLTVGRDAGVTLEVMQPGFRSEREAYGLDNGWFVDGGIWTGLLYPNDSATLGPLTDARPKDTRGRPHGPARWGAVGDTVTLACATPGTFVDALTTAITVGQVNVGGADGIKRNGNAAPPLVSTVNVRGAMLRMNGGIALVSGFTDSQHLSLTVLKPFTTTGTVLPAPDATAIVQSAAPPGSWSLTPRYVTLDFSGTPLSAATVSVFGDGADLGDVDLSQSAGVLTLEAPGASQVVAGYAYRSELETVKLETTSGPWQTAVGKTARVNRLYARLLDTVGGWQGPNFGQLDPLCPIRDFADPAGLPPPLFSGDERVTFPGGADTSAALCLLQDRPLPLCCLSLVAAVEVGV